MWRLFVLEDGTSCFRFYDARSGDRPYKALLLEDGAAEGEVVLDAESLPESGTVDPLEFPLDELLFLTLLGRSGGAELHACGVKAPDGRGFLFTGHSGDGKTTMARLWEAVPGAIVLSDDRIVVRPGLDGTWEMHGTPWHGEAELAAKARAEVAGAFVLDRGDRTVASPLRRTAAVAALLARSFPPFHAPGAMDGVLELLDRLVRDVAVERLEVRPGAGAIEAVLSRGR